MNYEEITAEVSLLITQMNNEPDDHREIYLQLMEKIRELRAFGMPIPDDLKRFEDALETDMAREKGPTIPH